MFPFPQIRNFIDNPVRFIIQVMKRGSLRLHDVMHIPAILFDDLLQCFKIFFQDRIDADVLPARSDCLDALLEERTRVCGVVTFRRADFFLFHRWDEDDVVEHPMSLWRYLHGVS